MCANSYRKIKQIQLDSTIRCGENLMSEFNDFLDYRELSNGNTNGQGQSQSQQKDDDGE